MDIETDTAELDQLQGAYKAAVEEGIGAIEREEELVSVTPHSVAKLDEWEEAHFEEEEMRAKVIALKKQYEDALRLKFFNF